MPVMPSSSESARRVYIYLWHLNGVSMSLFRARRVEFQRKTTARGYRRKKNERVYNIKLYTYIVYIYEPADSPGKHYI